MDSIQVSNKSSQELSLLHSKEPLTKFHKPKEHNLTTCLTPLLLDMAMELSLNMDSLERNDDDVI